MREDICGRGSLSFPKGEVTRRHLVQPMSLSKRRAGRSPAVLLLFALPLIAGCRDTPVVTEPVGETPHTVPATPATPDTPNSPSTPPGGGSLFISGIMTPQLQGVRVSRGGEAVTHADVTVNGFPIPHCCGDLYSGNLPEAVRAGDTLNLKVVARGVSFEAHGEVTATPTITAPAAGSTFSSSDSVSLAWSTPTDPDRFEVCLNCWENSLWGEMWPASGKVREFKIAPGSLVDFGGGAVVAVYAYKSNFLKSASPSDDATSNVVFFARSRDAIINIKY